MKFLFWNVQRLGSGTAVSKEAIIEQVLAEAIQLHNVDLAFLCEVTSTMTVGGVGINKQISVFKRGARATAAQLGYASIDSDLNEVVLQKFEIPQFHETFGFSAPRKGGNEFTKQSKRFVAFGGQYEGINVYIYHANASAKGAFLVAWVIEALRQEDDGEFVLMGDLNSQPTAVRTQLDLLDIDRDLFEFGHDGPTHNAKTGLTKTYDYAIGGFGLVPVVTKLEITTAIAHYSTNPAADMSDHLPIVVEY